MSKKYVWLNINTGEFSDSWGEEMMERDVGIQGHSFGEVRLSMQIEVARIVRIVRAHEGISQRELAERVECSSSLISSYERGKTVPTIERLLAIAVACSHHLGMSIRPRETDDGGA